MATPTYDLLAFYGRTGGWSADRHETLAAAGQTLTGGTPLSLLLNTPVGGASVAGPLVGGSPLSLGLAAGMGGSLAGGDVDLAATISHDHTMRGMLSVLATVQNPPSGLTVEQLRRIQQVYPTPKIIEGRPYQLVTNPESVSAFCGRYRAEDWTGSTLPVTGAGASTGDLSEIGPGSVQSGTLGTIPWVQVGSNTELKGLSGDLETAQSFAYVGVVRGFFGIDFDDGYDNLFTIYNNAGGADTNVKAAFLQDNRLRVTHGANPNTYSVDATSGTWQTGQRFVIVGIVYDAVAEEVRFYQNGQLTDSISITHSAFTDGDRIRIGPSGSNSSHMWFADMCFFCDAVSDDDMLAVHAWFANERGIDLALDPPTLVGLENTTKCVGAWTAEEFDGTPDGTNITVWTDQSGNGHDLSGSMDFKDPSAFETGVGALRNVGGMEYGDDLPDMKRGALAVFAVVRGNPASNLMMICLIQSTRADATPGMRAWHDRSVSPNHERRTDSVNDSGFDDFATGGTVTEQVSYMMGVSYDGGGINDAHSIQDRSQVAATSTSGTYSAMNAIQIGPNVGGNGFLNMDVACAVALTQRVDIGVLTAENDGGNWPYLEAYWYARNRWKV